MEGFHFNEGCRLGSGHGLVMFLMTWGGVGTVGVSEAGMVGDAWTLESIGASCVGVVGVVGVDGAVDEGAADSGDGLVRILGATGATGSGMLSVAGDGE